MHIQKSQVDLTLTIRTQRKWAVDISLPLAVSVFLRDMVRLYRKQKLPPSYQPTC